MSAIGNIRGLHGPVEFEFRRSPTFTGSACLLLKQGDRPFGDVDLADLLEPVQAGRELEGGPGSGDVTLQRRDRLRRAEFAAGRRRASCGGRSI